MRNTKRMNKSRNGRDVSSEKEWAKHRSLRNTNLQRERRGGKAIQ